MKLSLIGLSLLLATTSIARAEDIAVDVGLDAPVIVNTEEPLKLALFIEIGTNSAVQSTIKGVEAMAAKHGFSFDVFDARFDVARQVNQMESALLNSYNAWIVVPVEGSQVCDMVAERAPAANVLVAHATGTACGRSSMEGDDLWSPGTLVYVGGNETPSAFRAVMEKAVADNPGPQKVGILTGPNLHPITVSFDKALAEVTAAHPEFEVVAVHRTDYSPPDNQVKTQTLLQANPDLSIIIGAYTNMSKGAIPAMEAAGKLGVVKVYEAGGTEWSVEALKAGWIEATTGFYRQTAAEAAVQAILDARDGRAVPRVILNDGHPLIPGQVEGSVGLVTAENVEAYVPQSP
ncbi:sugar ABC transporter substrate-binding protein [Fertoebacter nigrum]|uniref:Sugar ABC transporter substrate-binding protein n=1 Tax=Fertoeibacter niger TaxID=2656921 RepID=A0A8X8KQD2_9RHOB|nr:sugar ABC transporter substrate-binding protein [Fertoeibacter niger]NUB45831.1 sugar ABC transporter substrate-binding protein [Fertoeibacter niger]